MSILVAYASKHGSTREIAERIAETLRAAGKAAIARAVQEAGDLDDYEAFVIGSAAYSTHWLKDATRFVTSNREVLAQRPVWLFSSGPLGAEAIAATAAIEISDAIETTAWNPAVAFEPSEIRGLRAAIHPRDHRIFSGALDPCRLSSGEWSCRNEPATRAILPEGDFRDWAQIESWAQEIAHELTRGSQRLPASVHAGFLTAETSSSRLIFSETSTPPVSRAALKLTP
jgi:menaquinone-dependent protoporphyrinogen oxidase